MNIHTISTIRRNRAAIELIFEADKNGDTVQCRFGSQGDFYDVDEVKE